MKLASIDIGTNTLRLLIGEIGPDGQIKDTILRREITRLGGKFNGRLHPHSKKRTLEALKEFAQTIYESKITKVRAAATSVMREAEDGMLFAEEIKAKMGIVVDIIDGNTEAALTLKGVFSALDDGQRMALIFDIGGGSTEYIVADKKEIKGLKSINMGVISLTESYLKSDPPSPSEIKDMTNAVDDYLFDLKNSPEGLPELKILEGNTNAILVGTAGTITSLAALDQNLEVYDTRKINNYVLTKESVERLFERLTGMSYCERAAMKALEEGRADLIIPGTIIVMRTMEEFGFNEMVVSDYGLLEGLLLDLAEREGLQK